LQPKREWNCKLGVAGAITIQKLIVLTEKKIVRFKSFINICEKLGAFMDSNYNYT
tara:strand:- start:731 stop:895 length:165 start_codon:yes stop_codon:yes gene_type:complete